MWTVPLSDEQATNLDKGSKAMLYISAFSAPLLNSCKNEPSSARKILIKVPYKYKYLWFTLSEAVANKVPSKFIER